LKSSKASRAVAVWLFAIQISYPSENIEQTLLISHFSSIDSSLNSDLRSGDKATSIDIQWAACESGPKSLINIYSAEDGSRQDEKNFSKQRKSERQTALSLDLSRGGKFRDFPFRNSLSAAFKKCKHFHPIKRGV
jgi:hypothetical protein